MLSPNPGNLAQSCAILAILCLGAGIGSFLGMAAYRLPRKLSFVRPARSFCPGCDRTIPWYRNLPVVSFLLQRGRCFCSRRERVSPRYFWLEVFCTVLFGLSAYLAWGNWGVFAGFGLFSAYGLLTGAIDLEHRIIPTSLSVQTAALGFAFALVGWNPLARDPSLLGRAWWSLGGFSVGAVTVGLLMLVGKVFCRPQPQVFDPPIEVEIHGRTVRSREPRGEWEEAPLSDYLLNRWERLEFHATGGGVETVTFQRATPQYRFTEKSVRQIVMPRDAIGYGDLKWLAALGAWVGPLGALETLGLSSILACGGIVVVWIRNRRKPTGMSFGPWLSAAAYILLALGERGR